jgi:hypothetical protein
MLGELVPQGVMCEFHASSRQQDDEVAIGA